MNVFMTDAGRFVELQGTAEAAPFDRRDLDALLALAETESNGSSRLQHAALERRRPPPMPVDRASPLSPRASVPSTSPIAR